MTLPAVIENDFEQRFEGYLLRPSDSRAVAHLVDILQQHPELHARYADSVRMQVHLRSVLQINVGLARSSARQQRVGRRNHFRPRARRDSRKTSFIILVAALFVLGIFLGLHFSGLRQAGQPVTVEPLAGQPAGGNVSFAIMSGAESVLVNDESLPSNQGSLSVAEGSLVTSTLYSSLRLLDDSRVVLFPDTQISMRDSRSGSGITLHSGTMIVGVKYDGVAPWRGSTEDGLTYTVTGTSFLVNRDDEYTQIRTHTGSVQVTTARSSDSVSLGPGMALRMDPQGNVEVGTWPPPAQIFSQWTAEDLQSIFSSGSDEQQLAALPDQIGWRLQLNSSHPLRKHGLSILVRHPRSPTQAVVDSGRGIFHFHPAVGEPSVEIFPSRDDQGALAGGGTNFILDPHRGVLQRDLTQRYGRGEDQLQQLWSAPQMIKLDILASYGIPKSISLFLGAHSQESMLIGIAFAEVEQP